MMRVLVFTCMSTAACVGSSLPPPTPRVDPMIERDHLVAFARSGLAVAVLRETGDTLELLRLEPDTGRATRIGPLDADTARDLRDGVTPRQDWVGGVFGSEAGSLLIDAGFAPASALDTEDLAIPAGRVHFDGEDVRVIPPEGDAVVLRSLDGQRRPDTHRWYVDIDERRVALELRYERTPVRSSSLWVFELLRMEAEVLSQRAFELFADEQIREASKVWRQALKLYPNHAPSRYNLACAEARMGDRREAYRHLAAAIALDPVRFKGIAKVDRDLQDVRDLPEFHELIFRELDDRR
ncbi:MAG: tetratricopeptide repeat protein [Myxococcota bacterium]